MRTKKPFWHISLIDSVYTITNNDDICIFRTRSVSDLFDVMFLLGIKDVSRISYVNVPIFIQYGLRVFLTTP